MYQTIFLKFIDQEDQDTKLIDLGICKEFTYSEPSEVTTQVTEIIQVPTLVDSVDENGNTIQVEVLVDEEIVKDVTEIVYTEVTKVIAEEGYSVDTIGIITKYDYANPIITQVPHDIVVQTIDENGNTVETTETVMEDHIEYPTTILDGWHVNVLSDKFTEEQLASLPTVVPTKPVRVFA